MNVRLQYEDGVGWLISLVGSDFRYFARRNNRVALRNLRSIKGLVIESAVMVACIPMLCAKFFLATTSKS